MAHTKDKRNKTKTLAMTALFAALSFTATAVLVIPLPSGGYLNLGDTVILLGAYLLGPVYGAAAGGIGAALADLTAGFAMYVPGTLAVKAVMALAAGLLYRLLHRRNFALPVCGILGETVMVGGYWLYEGLLLGSFAGAALNIPGNLLQGAVGLAASTALALALKKIGALHRLFPGF